MSEKQNALEKVAEANFYLKLMDQLELKKQPLTDNFDYQTEYSYLLSGFLNACYSACEFLKQNKSFKDKVKKFVYDHSFFYGSGPNGGLRTVSTHFRPVKPAKLGYISPPSDNVIVRFREKKESIDPHNVVLNFGSNSLFYLDETSAQNSINDKYAEHIICLRKFIEEIQ